MIYLHFVWIGLPQDGPIVNDTYRHHPLFATGQIFHDISAPLSLERALDQTNTTIIFWCLEEYVEEYKKIFKQHAQPVAPTTPIEVMSCERLIHAFGVLISLFLKFLNDFKMHPSSQTQDTVSSQTVSECWKTRTKNDFGRMDELEKALYRNLQSGLEQVFYMKDKPCLELYYNYFNNLNYICQYMHHECSMTARSVLGALNILPLFHNYNKIRVNVNFKNSMSYFVLCTLGGYYLDSNVFANSQPIRFPVPETTSSVLDVWFMSSNAYDRGIYLALASHIKFQHFATLYAEGNIHIKLLYHNIIEFGTYQKICAGAVVSAARMGYALKLRDVLAEAQSSVKKTS